MPGDKKFELGDYVEVKDRIAIFYELYPQGRLCTVHVEMLHNHAFYFFGKEPGLGGLPTGASGRVVCLLSGGIDSPVAAWRIMRRGCTVSLDGETVVEKGLKSGQVIVTEGQLGGALLILYPHRKDPALNGAGRDV